MSYPLSKSDNFIRVRGAKTHTLKNLNIDIPQNRLIVFCGPSGSGKSSMAYNTLFTEGRRKFADAVSSKQNNLVSAFCPAEVDCIYNLSPTIAPELKSRYNYRETIGSLTNISRYLKLLFAKSSIPYCPYTGKKLERYSTEEIIEKALSIINKYNKQQVLILSPYSKNLRFIKDEIETLVKHGITKARLNNSFISILDIHKHKLTSRTNVDLCIDKLTSSLCKTRITESLLKALSLGDGIAILVTSNNEETWLSNKLFSTEIKKTFSDFEANDFSFNSTKGMCPACLGKGISKEWNLNTIITPSKSIDDGGCVLTSMVSSSQMKPIYESLSKHYSFDTKSPLKNISQQAKDALLFGVPNLPVKSALFNKKIHTKTIVWEGLLSLAKRNYLATKSSYHHKKIKHLLEEQICSSCNGSRLQPYPAAAKLCGKTFLDIHTSSICQLHEFFSYVTTILKDDLEIINEIQNRINFLKELGIEYLSFGRDINSLSGGEKQRVQLSSQMGSGLVGITYVFDEPSVGLHQQEVKLLVKGLQKLRDIGNTVIVVEHDELVISSADHVIEFGPSGGESGGYITFQGPPEHLNKRYYSENVTRTGVKRNLDNIFTLEGIFKRNIANENISIPTGTITTITGISGSGKSSLIHEVLIPSVNSYIKTGNKSSPFLKNITGNVPFLHIIEINQSPVIKANRSNPATYTKVFDEIRYIFSNLPESKAKGFAKGRFSFNVKNGSCVECNGLGFITMDPGFSKSDQIVCLSCKGKCFNEHTLSVRYNGKNISDVLNMTIDEALVFFQNFPKITKILSIVQNVCLGYLKLNMPLTKLSGGESQRIKLAKELSKGSSQKTLYTLDEPTTGLHHSDIHKLLKILHQLVDSGHSVIIIEHNLIVINQSDWVIEMGPKGGEKGGKIIAQGLPEHIAKLNTPTGNALTEEKFTLKANPPNITEDKKIIVRGAANNNLKNVNAEIPHNKITVCSGPSGSGKSSFALDSVFAECNKRYFDFFDLPAGYIPVTTKKSKLDQLETTTPTVSIAHYNKQNNQRGTVGTATGMYDMISILYARIGTPFCPETNEIIKNIFPSTVIEKLNLLPNETKLEVLVHISNDKSISRQKKLEEALDQGFNYVRVGNSLIEISEQLTNSEQISHDDDMYLIIDKLKIGKASYDRWIHAIEKATLFVKDKLIVRLEENIFYKFNFGFCSEKTGKQYPKITYQTFSFKHKDGMCNTCNGTGVTRTYPILDMLSDKTTSLIETINYFFGETTPALQEIISELIKESGAELSSPINSLTSSQLDVLLNESRASIKIDGGTLKWKGLLNSYQKLKIKNEIDNTPEIICPSCRGSRICQIARHVLINAIPIHELCSWAIDKVKVFIDNLQSMNKDKTLNVIFERILNVINILINLGLDHISISRTFFSLSTGELQRIRIATQTVNDLSNILYVIEDPMSGFHPEDCIKLVKCFNKLKAQKNTLLLVDNSQFAIDTADVVLEFGPSGGKNGGYLCESTNSRTPTTLNKLPYISTDSQMIVIPEIASCESTSLHIPTNSITCIVGVSGSGKSKLLNEIYTLLISTDHKIKPVLVSLSFSNTESHFDIMCYLALDEYIRRLFASTSKANELGLSKSHFHYFSDLETRSDCNVSEDAITPSKHNTFFQVTYNGLNYFEVYDMSISSAKIFFTDHKYITDILNWVTLVGLGYLELKKKINTLSTGEKNRLEISKTISSREQSEILYLFEEPTTGLNDNDITSMLNLFDTITKLGCTVMCISSRVYMIKNSDWLIEISGTDNHTHILYQGSVDNLIKISNNKSVIKQYLGA